MRTKLAPILASLALALGGLAFASPASAQPTTGLITCPLGTQNTHYTPGLTYTTRPTSFDSDGTVAACVDLSGSGIAGASYSISGRGTAGPVTRLQRSRTGWVFRATGKLLHRRWVV